MLSTRFFCIRAKVCVRSILCACVRVCAVRLKVSQVCVKVCGSVLIVFIPKYGRLAVSRDSVRVGICNIAVIQR